MSNDTKNNDSKHSYGIFGQYYRIFEPSKRRARLPHQWLRIDNDGSDCIVVAENPYYFQIIKKDRWQKMYDRRTTAFGQYDLERRSSPLKLDSTGGFVIPKYDDFDYPDDYDQHKFISFFGVSNYIEVLISKHSHVYSVDGSLMYPEGNHFSSHTEDNLIPRILTKNFLNLKNEKK